MIKRHYKTYAKHYVLKDKLMNEYDSVQPAYENSPKEVNNSRRMPQGDKQFGKESKTMPQKKESRHKEHR